MELTKYEIPGRPHVWGWDIPGSGILKHPTKPYIGKWNLMAFDLLNVVCSGRITGQIALITFAMQACASKELKRLSELLFFRSCCKQWHGICVATNLPRALLPRVALNPTKRSY